MDADRERRRGEIEREVRRRLLSKRAHGQVVGASDVRSHLLTEMILDIQDEIADLRRDVERVNRISTGGY